jgi:hypothetical protein
MDITRLKEAYIALNGEFNRLRTAKYELDDIDEVKDALNRLEYAKENLSISIQILENL